MDLLSAPAAASRIATDRDLLAKAIAGLGADALAAPYEVAGGPLGDFCESLHDLVAHITMWDEISLAVLAGAGRGRDHWSLVPRWDDPEAGRALNRGGVAAGRHLPAELLLHRFEMTRDALVAEVGRYQSGSWELIGPVAQRAMTVPGHDPFWHTAVHLGGVPG
jgi:hypothetical protein